MDQRGFWKVVEDSLRGAAETCEDDDEVAEIKEVQRLVAKMKRATRMKMLLRAFDLNVNV
jgi:hypothetical protein